MVKEAKIVAITGPSGVGKNTLGEMLKKNFGFAVPTHCTTRTKREDDEDGFYSYLSHEEYAKLLTEGKFLFSSGDGPEVKKEYGNFYGVLKDDINEALKESENIILYVSYKDLQALHQLKIAGAKIDIIALKFKDIKKGVLNRISLNSSRNHSESDIQKRVQSALDLDAKYSKILENLATSIIYTDELNISQMFRKACLDLNLTV